MPDTPLARRVINIVGPPGPAKTAFLGELARELTAAGLQVAVLSLELTSPLPDEAKDTGRYRRAGAWLAALAGPGGVMLTYRLPGPLPPSGLDQILPLLAPWADGLLVDGAVEGLPWILLAPTSGPPGPGPEVLAVVEGFSVHTPVKPAAVARVAALLRARWGVP